jgi:uncharacterized protein with GYD domain
VQTYIMLTKLAHGALKNPGELETIEKQIMDRVAGQCPEVKWVTSYAILGPYDYLDVFEAPDLETAMQVSTIIRTYGHAQTEIWGAAPWDRFKDMIRHLPGTAE